MPQEKKPAVRRNTDPVTNVGHPYMFGRTVDRGQKDAHQALFGKGAKMEPIPNSVREEGSYDEQAWDRRPRDYAPDQKRDIVLPVAKKRTPAAPTGRKTSRR